MENERASDARLPAQDLYPTIPTFLEADYEREVVALRRALQACNNNIHFRERVADLADFEAGDHQIHG